MKYKKKVILLFSNYLPLQIWTLKICINDISKTITARSMEGYLSKKSIHINESFVHAIALALW